jgi:hypothetical protein
VAPERFEEGIAARPAGDPRSKAVRRTNDHRIDRTFGLDDVPEALAHVGEGHALGKVVVTPI